MINKISTLVLIIAMSSGYHSQILVSDADYSGGNSMDCGGVFGTTAKNFYDTGGVGSNYGANENETITFCPDNGGSKVVFSCNVLTTGLPADWDIHSSDTLYIYDGPTTSSPLLYAGNSDSDPNGVVSIISSFTNASGCLTIQFKSDAVDHGNGWEANVRCASPNQPMEGHIKSYISGTANGANDNIDDILNDAMTAPLPDIGYTNVCQGDSIMFVNATNYLYEPNNPNSIYSPTSGGGYNQSNPGSHTTFWTFSNGTTQTGDTVWFKPQATIGFFVDMLVTDSRGVSTDVSTKVRVSTTPSFVGCMPEDDIVCIGQNTNLIGGISPTDTVGANANGSAFTISGTFGDPLFLPDGGNNEYTADIVIAGYPGSAEITNAGDLASLCVDMEHSFLGDLEMMLTCPDGSTTMIFNSYNGANAGQLFTGGFGGGGTDLGGANTNDLPNPQISPVGDCETYCFSDNASAWDSWATSYNTVISSTGSFMVEPGTYNPEVSFISSLAGCPINGTWTLTVKDNWGIDNGWICQWGINFDGSLQPVQENYSPAIVTDQWLPHPTIVVDANDTSIVARPNTVGNTDYTFQVTDNFGCVYDTIISVNVVAGPSINKDTSVCGDYFQFSNTYVPNVGGVSGGNWFYLGSDNLTITTSPGGNPTTTFINPTITPGGKGIYDIYFTDNFCHDTLKTTLFFHSDPTASIVGKDTICERDTSFLSTVLLPGEVGYWTGPNGDIISTDSSAIALTSGQYQLAVSNVCSTSTSTIDITTQPCSVPNVITPFSTPGQNDTFFTNYASIHNDVHLTIYNRWGRVVYKTESYDNTWAGDKTNGKDLNGGVYYYVMTWDGNTKDEAGTITVFAD